MTGVEKGGDVEGVGGKFVGVGDVCDGDDVWWMAAFRVDDGGDA